MTRKNVGASGRVAGKPKQKVRARGKGPSNLGGMKITRSQSQAPLVTGEVAKSGSSIVTIRDMEKVRDVPYSQTFQKWILQIQPGNPGMFPRLSRRAVTFEKYFFTKLVLHYIGSCASSNAGVVAALKFENLARADPATLSDLLNNSHAAQAAPWKKFSLNLLEGVDRRWRYVEDDLVLPTNRDSRLDQMGKVVLASSGSSASLSDQYCGSFWIEYEVRLDCAASLDFASPLNEWAAITPVISESAAAGLPILPLLEELSTNSYGNLRLVELPDPISGSEYCLAPLEDVEGTFMVEANATGGGLVGTDNIRVATNGSYVTTGQTTGQVWNWDPIVSYVNQGGTSIIALINAKAAAIQQTLESYLIKFAIYAATATVTSLRLRFFPNDVSTPWPPGHPGYPSLAAPRVFHTRSDHIQNLLRDFKTRHAQPLMTAEAINDLRRLSLLQSTSPHFPQQILPTAVDLPPTVPSSGAPAKFEFIGRTPCPSEPAKCMGSPPVVDDKERSSSTTGHTSAPTPPSSQGCPPTEHELNLRLAELKALKTALYSRVAPTQ